MKGKIILFVWCFLICGFILWRNTHVGKKRGRFKIIGWIKQITYTIILAKKQNKIPSNYITTVAQSSNTATKIKASLSHHEIQTAVNQKSTKFRARMSTSNVSHLYLAAGSNYHNATLRRATILITLPPRAVNANTLCIQERHAIRKRLWLWRNVICHFLVMTRWSNCRRFH